MSLEEIEPGSEHVIEIPAPRRVLIVRRRSYPVLIGAACLALGGIALGVFLVGRQRASDEHLTTDALQREELRDGWKALGAAAALDAQTASAPAPTAPPANVLIVTVPGQSGPQGPQGAPGQPGQTVVVGTPSTAATVPSMGNSNASGSNVGGQVPGGGQVTTYGVPVPAYGTGAQPQNPVNGVVPTGTLGPAGNANVPGGTSNPALPDNGSSGSALPAPGSPNVGNPTSNVPSGTSNLPSGSSSLPSGVP